MVGQMYPLGTVRKHVLTRRRVSPSSLFFAIFMIVVAGVAIGTGIKILTADDCYSVTFETRYGDTSVGKNTAILPCF